MIIWYRNSFLASVFSLFGCAAVIFAVSDLVKEAAMRELALPEAIGLIVGGVVCIILGKVISVNKAKKQQKKAEQAARTSAMKASNAAPEVYRKPAKKAVTFAGICFLLTAVLGVGAAYLLGMWNVHNPLVIRETLMEGGMCLLLMLACFRTRHTQSASVMHVLGLLGLIAVHVRTALGYYRAYGFGGYSASEATYNAMISVPLLKLAAFFLMLIFAFCAMRKAKERCGGFVRVFWLLPALLLALAYTKEIFDSHVIHLIQIMAEKGSFHFRPEFMDAASMVFMVLGVFFAGLGLRGVCRKPEPCAPQQTAEYVQPAPVVAPVQPQPEPQRVAYEAPKPASQPEPAPAQPDPHDLEKKIQAYKDLLECGILSQEEYNQKIRELTHV